MANGLSQLRLVFLFYGSEVEAGIFHLASPDGGDFITLYKNISRFE